MNWIPRANVQESVRKVIAGSQDKLSSERLHSIIDSMETVVDSFNERLIMDNRLDQNDQTCQRELESNILHTVLATPESHCSVGQKEPQ